MKNAKSTLLFVLLTLNTLDLTTTLVPHPFDGWWTTLERPEWCLYIQLPLLMLWCTQSWQRRERLFEWWHSLQIPRVPKLIFAGFVCVVLTHAALRVEHYPFSPVIMFSVPKDDIRPVSRTRRMVVVDEGQGWRPISLLLEGNPFLSQYLRTDYKSGWTMRMYASSDVKKANWIAQRLYAAGAPLVGWAEVTYTQATGSVQNVREIARFNNENQP